MYRQKIFDSKGIEDIDRIVVYDVNNQFVGMIICAVDDEFDHYYLYISSRRCVFESIKLKECIKKCLSAGLTVYKE